MLLYKFEDTLYQAELLAKLPAPEEQPFEFKYRARKLLQDLRTEIKQEPLMAILDFQIGLNFLDCEENGQGIQLSDLANKYIAQSLVQFSTIHPIEPYLGYIQQIYNHLGFLAINRDENEIGLSILAKAEQLGKQLQQAPPFTYKFQGGFDQVDQTYTITQFYIAQAYTKLGLKDKAAIYCASTMQRQFTSNTYELKDFCVNCISLAEYYSEQGNISQALYFLQAGESIIPENKNKKLRATFQMATGKAMGEYMAFSIDKIKNKSMNDPELPILINKQIVQFQGITAKYIHFKVSQTYEDIKSLYRQANTMYQKALNYFVLDGYVTEHIQIQQEISQMLRQLVQLEPELQNVISFTEKRIKLLEPIMEQLNPKAYQNTYDKILVEVAEINNELYELIHSFNHIDDMNSKNKKLAEKTNKAAQATIKYYKLIIESLLKLEENQKDHAYYSSIITAYFNIAKAQSKMQPKEKEEKVNQLVESLKTYNHVIEYIRKEEKENEFQQILTMAQEMLQLLPSRIDRVNYHNK